MRLKVLKINKNFIEVCKYLKISLTEREPILKRECFYLKGYDCWIESNGKCFSGEGLRMFFKEQLKRVVVKETLHATSKELEIFNSVPQNYLKNSFIERVKNFKQMQSIRIECFKISKKVKK